MKNFWRVFFSLLCIALVFIPQSANALMITEGDEVVSSPSIIMRQPMLKVNAKLSPLTDNSLVFGGRGYNQNYKMPVTITDKLYSSVLNCVNIKANGWNTVKYDFWGYSINGCMLPKDSGSTKGKLDLSAYVEDAGTYLELKDYSQTDRECYAIEVVTAGSEGTELKQNISIIPLFTKKVPPAHSISVRATSGGSVEYYYINNDTWMIKAAVADNYDFDKWQKSVDGGKTWQDTKIPLAGGKVVLQCTTLYRAVFTPVDIAEITPVAYALPSEGDIWKLEAKLKFARELDSSAKVTMKVYEGDKADADKLLGTSTSTAWGAESLLVATAEKRPSKNSDIKVLLVAELDGGRPAEAVYELKGTLDASPAEQTIDTLEKIFINGENTLQLTACGEPAATRIKWTALSGDKVFADGVIPFSFVMPSSRSLTIDTHTYVENIKDEVYRADAGDGRVAYATVHYSSGTRAQLGIKLTDSLPTLRLGESIDFPAEESVPSQTVERSEVTVASSDEQIFTAAVIEDPTKSGKKVEAVRITGVGYGEATLTIACGDWHWQCPVRVIDRDVYVRDVRISSGQAEIKTGETLALTASYLPDYADATVQWLTSDPDIATVSANGAVKGKAAGNVQITARVLDSRGGVKTAVCRLKVKESLYQVSVYVPKQYVPANGLSIYPCAGLDENNRDTFDETAQITDYALDRSSDSQYNIYRLTLPMGTYSYRAVGSDGKSLGGACFALPAAYNGQSEDGYYPREDTKIYLRLAEAYITNTNGGQKAAAEDFTVENRNSFGVAANGEPYVNDKGYVCYPSLLYVNGNALLHYTTIRPANSYSAQYGLGPVNLGNNAIVPSADKIELAQALGVANEIVINTPAGADVTLYERLLNYSSVPVKETLASTLADGTVDHRFNIGGATSFRVSMEGKRTQASYFSYISPDKDGRIVVAFPENADPKALDTRGGAYNESSLLLNINERNRLSLQVGESFKLRAYRAWEIIDTIVDNKQIMPDYHYNVLSGQDVVEVKPVSSGNNAGDNWAWIKALKDGVAIIEVSYDAIDIINGGHGWGDGMDGFYGAADPDRTGIAVVTVGKDYADIPGINWDAEFDTVYFVDKTGFLTILPAGNVVTVEVAAVKDGQLGAWQRINGSKGSFAVPIVPGNNIIKITADGLTDYRVVRGAQITPIINVVGSEDNSKIYPGDTVELSFKGFYQSVPKMGGIYNPGFPDTMRVVYEAAGQKISSGGTQYFIREPNENKLTFTIPQDAQGSFVLNSGKLVGTMMSFKPLGAHRDLTDMGTGAVFNAAETRLPDIALPDIILKLADGARPAGQQTTATQTGQAEVSEPVVKTQSKSYYKTTGLDFTKGKYGIDAAEADGYVTVSFEDYVARIENSDLPTPLGQIIEPTLVPYKTGDNMAVVTLRLLDALGIEHKQTGMDYSAFYLSSIDNFKLADGTVIASMGEFKSGAQSGWMVTLNKWFVNSSTSDFQVSDGDIIRWQNTCQLGADIGTDWRKPDATISGIEFAENYGVLSPQFSEKTKKYVYEIPKTVKMIKLQAELNNYWSKLTCTVDGKAYKPMQEIPVNDGTVITLESVFTANVGEKPSDTDKVTITVRYQK